MHLYLNDILALLFSFCRSNQRLSLFTQTLKNVDKKLILFSIMFFCHQSMYMNNVMMYKRKQKKFTLRNHHFLQNYHYHMYSIHDDCEFEVMDFIILPLLRHDVLEHVVINSFQLLF
jgi:hypothetical protein